MCATYRTINVLSPKLDHEIKLAKISGRVLSITPVIKGSQVVLDKIYIKDFGNKKLDEIEIGDYIKFRATLRPSSEPFVPRGYDFSRQNFFDQIGVTGYNNSNIYVIKK